MMEQQVLVVLVAVVLVAELMLHKQHLELPILAEEVVVVVYCLVVKLVLLVVQVVQEL
jgi:hypothetical protein